MDWVVPGKQRNYTLRAALGMGTTLHDEPAKGVRGSLDWATKEGEHGYKDSRRQKSPLSLHVRYVYTILGPVYDRHLTRV